MTVLYLLVLLALGVYSYSQIDLNLTLLHAPWFLSFQSLMVQLGYFHRPQSTAIFVILLSLLSIFYFFFWRRNPTLRETIVILFGISLLGLFSYPAFSHDIFNYIFDARIFAFHHANPYTTTALMFPNDTWTRFMNWTHRPYPYGPTFLPLTIFFYFLGLNKFILTLFWFKTMAVAAYLGCVYIIFRLTKARGLVLFALNPLIIIEAVVSSHLDIVMLFFGLLAYYLLVNNRKVVSLLSLVISIGIKYATILLLPFFIWPKLSPTRRLQAILVAVYLGALFQVGSREVLPHYFIVPFGFSALSQNRSLVLVILALSIVLLLARYYGFLSTGIWTTIKIFP